MKPLYITQVSSKLPNDTLSNREFSFLVPENARPEGFHSDTADEWIFSRSGISTRHVLAREFIGTNRFHPDAELDLAIAALNSFTEQNAKQWEEVDAILCVRTSPQNSMPGLSQKLHQHFCGRFGTPEKAIFTADLVQASTGMVQALTLVRNAGFKKAWIIACEILTPYLNLNDVGTSMLFGDGVAAICVSNTLPDQPNLQERAFEILGETFYSIPDPYQVLHHDGTPESFRMKGPELYRRVVPQFRIVSERLLQTLNFDFSNVDYLLPHQANTRIVEKAASTMGFARDRLISNISKVGNTSSASMFIALDHFITSKPLAKNTRILMSACGSGLSSGALLIQKI